jgi:tyrosinase
MLSQFEQQRRALHDHVDLAFRASSMNEFSKTMEIAHGWIHGIIGGGWLPGTFQGHMWPLEYSAFEPLFMLHHTCVFFPASILLRILVCVVLLIGLSNVDRLFSMYQTAHPERTLNPESVENNGNVYIEDNQVVDGNTALLPFRRSDGNGFWTTNDVQDTHLFGYAYPETSAGLNADAAIAKLYSSGARTLIKSNNSSIHAKHAVAEGNDGTGTLSFNTTNTYTDYSVQGSTENSLGTFSATFYFNPQIAGRETTEVGSWINVVMQQRQNVPKRSNGTISLTSGLMDRIADGDLESLDVRDVVPYLKSHLEWTIRDVRIA